MTPVPLPQDEDYLARRFMAVCYRTSRALLRARHLIPQGRAFFESLEHGAFERTIRIDPGDPLLGFAAGEIGEQPTGEDRLGHAFAAVQLGYSTDHPALHLFLPQFFDDYFPSVSDLLDFEYEILTYAHKRMTASGAVSALRAFETLFETRPHQHELADWQGLCYAISRAAGQASQDDQRSLMVARLEDLAKRARKALDIRTEATILRAIGQIQGLNYQDEEKQQRALLAMLGAPAQAHQPPQLPS